MNPTELALTNIGFRELSCYHLAEIAPAIRTIPLLL